MTLAKAKTAEIPVLDAIYRRRTVRSYKDAALDKEMIRTLLAAAVQAPTAMHEEPWAFTVIQDPELLRQLSEGAKKAALKEAESMSPARAVQTRAHLADPDFNVFYNAGTLVVIWAKPLGSFVAADCWLAAENLMLAACGLGLGSCVIGFSLAALNTPEWKERLGVDEKMIPVAPIILGVPDGLPPPRPRKEPEILSWL